MLMWLDKHRYTQGVLDDFFSAVVLPALEMLDYPFDVGRKISKKFSTPDKSRMDKLIEENKRLKKKVLELELAGIENRNYRRLLKAHKKVREDVRLAEIYQIAKDPDTQLIKINLGRKNCVIPGQPLIDADGVIGQVIMARTYTSTVRLITDLSHKMHVQIRATGYQTLAVGDGKSRLVKLPYVSLSAKVKINDEVITSGLDGVYPYGYMVGKVTKIEKQEVKGVQEITVTPTARINHIREALLVWTEKMKAKAKKQTKIFGFKECVYVAEASDAN